jgi:site-specific DNA recombinase
MHEAERAGLYNPPFCKSLQPLDLRHKSLFGSSLSSLCCWWSSIVKNGCFDPKQGQIRDKFPSQEKGQNPVPWILLFASIVPIFPPGNNSSKKPLSKRQQIIQELQARTEKEVQETYQLYLDQVPLERWPTIGAVYARFSTKDQDSASDQVRKCLEFALREKIHVPLENIHYDIATRGSKSNRPGINQIKVLLQTKAIHVLLVFSTSRLARKTYKALTLVEEECVGQGIRCVFTNQTIDTADENSWRAKLSFYAVFDEMTVTTNTGQISAAQERMFEGGLVTGAITFGYQGIPDPHLKTKKGTPKNRIAIHPEDSEIVRKIFHWFAVEELPMKEIARQLNTNFPKWSEGAGWSAGRVANILRNQRYAGLWCYGKKQSVWNSKKDYSTQVLRKKPLKQIQFENFRIVSDELWFKAQARLESNASDVKGRKPGDLDSSKKPRILNGMFYCPTHEQNLLVGGYFGRYMYCPKCNALPVGERPLFSHLPRVLALKVLSKKAGVILKEIHGLLDFVYEAFKAKLESGGKPDEKQLIKLKKNLKTLSLQIQTLIENPGETETDLQENMKALKQMRKKRAELELQISQLDSATNKKPIIPSKEQLAEKFKDLDQLLIQSACSTNAEEQLKVRQLFAALIEGKISLYQMGERKSKKGYLQGRFKINLAKDVLGFLNATSSLEPAGELEITVDFKEEVEECKDVEEVMRLFQEGLMNSQIAGKLGFSRGKVTSLIKEGHAKLGLEYQDGRARRATLLKKTHKESVHISIADKAKALWDEKLSILQIASKLGYSAPTIEKALDYWHDCQGVKRPTTEERRQKLLEQIKALYDQGRQYQEIGALVGLCARSVKHVLKEYLAKLGIQIPDGRSRK